MPSPMMYYLYSKMVFNFCIAPSHPCFRWGGRGVSLIRCQFVLNRVFSYESSWGLRLSKYLISECNSNYNYNYRTIRSRSLIKGVRRREGRNSEILPVIVCPYSTPRSCFLLLFFHKFSALCGHLIKIYGLSILNKSFRFFVTTFDDTIEFLLV